MLEGRCVKRRILTAAAGLLMGVSVGVGTVAAETRPEITVGFVDTFSPAFYIGTYAATLDHLTERLPQYRFRFVEVDYRNLQGDIERLKPNFLVSSASTFVSLIEPFGAHQVATKEPLSADDAVHSVASAFVVRSDSSIRTLSDAKGKRAAATSESSFDGWLIGAGEIARRGEELNRFFGTTTFTDYAIPGPALLVKMGLADVAVLAACELEDQTAVGRVEPGELRVLDDVSEGRGCRRSTPRYPDVVFASLAGVAPGIVKDVTVALLSMPQAGHDFQWTIADDFVPTFSLLKTLHLPPYAVQPLTAAQVWRDYRTEILLVLGLLAAVAFHIVTINLLVRRRTRELKESLAETQHYFEEAQTTRLKLVTLERLHIVNQLSSLFAHEIKQPLMNITLYAGALQLFLKKTGGLSEKAQDFLSRITAEVERSSDIVEHVRSYAKKRETKKEVVALADAVSQSIRTVGGRVKPVVIAMAQVSVSADPFELQFILTNFIKNAQAAVAEEMHPRIAIAVSVSEGRVFVNVEDNGPSLSEEAFAALGTMGRSTKEDGLGFGLAIAASLAEKSGGHLAFDRAVPHGLRVTLVMNAKETKDENDGAFVGAVGGR